jgi:succinylglutamic semialdehyde dehydrogenase
MSTVQGKAWIGGQWVEGAGQSWQRRSPCQNQLVWEGGWCSPEQTGQAVVAAREAAFEWAEQKLDDRIAICRKFAQVVEQRKEELAALIAIEVGKPLWESRTEVTGVIGKVENSIDALMKRRWTTMETSGDFMAVTRFRPHGVLLVLGPFNFPAHIPGGHIVPALLAGNTLVFKPSEHAPATGQWLCHAWQAAGLPPGVLNLVHGAAETAQVASQDDVDGILFTGSYRAGASLHRALAGRPEKVLALELGGNNPLVIHGVSDFRAAAITCILSAYLTSGQRCTCTRRLIVSGRDTYQRTLDQLQQLIPQIRVGLPLDEPQPFMGPLIHSKAAEQLLEYQSNLVNCGGETIVSSALDRRSSSLLTPGLVAMPVDASLEDSEHFGPVLTIQCAENLDQAIAMAGDTRFGLSAGFLGDNMEDFHYFLHRVRAGVINWNRQTTGASSKLPFGGVGLSGNHQPSGYYAADYCSYPVASLESHELVDANKPLPGLDFMGSQ